MDELEKKKFTRFKNMTKKGRDEYLHELEKEMDDLLDDVKSNTQSAATFMARVPEVMKEINVQLCTGIPNGESYKFGVDLGDLNKNLSQAGQKAYTKLKIFYAQLKAYMDTGIGESQEAVKQAIEEASQALSGAVADIKESVDGIVMQMEDILKEIQAGIEDVVDQAKDAINQVKDTITDLVDKAKDAWEKFIAEVKRIIDEVLDELDEFFKKLKAFFNGEIDASELFSGLTENKGFVFGDEELEWQRQQYASENEGFVFGDEELEWQRQQYASENQGFVFGDEELEWQRQQYEKANNKKKDNKKQEKKAESDVDDGILFSYDPQHAFSQGYVNTSGCDSSTQTCGPKTSSHQKSDEEIIANASSFVAGQVVEKLALLLLKMPKENPAGAVFIGLQISVNKYLRELKAHGYTDEDIKELLRPHLHDFVDSDTFKVLITPTAANSQSLEDAVHYTLDYYQDLKQSINDGDAHAAGDLIEKGLRIQTNVANGAVKTATTKVAEFIGLEDTEIFGIPVTKEQILMANPYVFMANAAVDTMGEVNGIVGNDVKSIVDLGVLDAEKISELFQ